METMDWVCGRTVMIYINDITTRKERKKKKGTEQRDPFESEFIDSYSTEHDPVSQSKPNRTEPRERTRCV